MLACGSGLNTGLRVAVGFARCLLWLYRYLYLAVTLPINIYFLTDGEGLKNAHLNEAVVNFEFQPKNFRLNLIPADGDNRCTNILPNRE